MSRCTARAYARGRGIRHLAAYVLIDVQRERALSGTSASVRRLVLIAMKPTGAPLCSTLVDLVDDRHVGVGQCRGGPRLSQEVMRCVTRITRHAQELQCDGAPEAQVLSAIDIAHGPRAQMRSYSIMGERLADHSTHYVGGDARVFLPFLPALAGAGRNAAVHRCQRFSMPGRDKPFSSVYDSSALFDDATALSPPACPPPYSIADISLFAPGTGAQEDHRRLEHAI